MMREVWVFDPNIWFKSENGDIMYLVRTYHVSDSRAIACWSQWFSSIEEAKLKAIIAGAELKQFSLKTILDHVFMRRFEHNELPWYEIEAQFTVA